MADDPFEMHAIQLTHVAPYSKTAIEAVWSDGYRAVVDLSPLMKNRHFIALRDPVVLAQATITDWGGTISWPGTVEWGADNLRHLANTQASNTANTTGNQ